MNKIQIIQFVIVLIVAMSCGTNNKTESKTKTAIKVEVKHENGKYQFYRAGKPYYINGAGYTNGNLQSLKSHGANSIRTWSTKNATQTLDLAHENRLTVMLGLYVERERLGFDYNDTLAVTKQLHKLKNEVEKYKDHPALLAWGIGNELNLHSTNLKVWDAVNEIAKMIHEIDGNHPVTTMLAGIGKKEVDYIKTNCPDIDFLSIQMYKAIDKLKFYVDNAGWDGPYVVTEWGLDGHWNVDTTEWGIPIEPTSKEKALKISNRWDNAIMGNKAQCMGSYVFLWGQKQERTPTWYGLLLESGEETEAVDVLHYKWSGKYPDNRAPSIDSLFLNNKTKHDNVYLDANYGYLFKVYSHDLDNDKLTYKFEIIPDNPETFGIGGDQEARPSNVFSMTQENSELKFKSPQKTGAYRIYVYVLDGRDNAATGNIPFFIK